MLFPPPNACLMERMLAWQTSNGLVELRETNCAGLGAVCLILLLLRIWLELWLWLGLRLELRLRLRLGLRLHLRPVRVESML